MENASVARSLRFRDTTIAFAPRTVQDEAVKEKEEGGGGRGETNAERDEENEERERGQSSHGVRSTERSPFFSLRFSFLPLPFQLFSLYPLSSSTHWVHACTYASSILSPPLLLPVHSFVESPLAFSAHEKHVEDGRWCWSCDGGWRRRWRWRTTPLSFLPCLPILSSKRRKEEERRGITASAKSRLMKSQFKHFTIGRFHGRGRIEEEEGRGSVGDWSVKADLFGGASADPFCIGIRLTRDPRSLMSRFSLAFACLAIDESSVEA